MIHRNDRSPPPSPDPDPPGLADRTRPSRAAAAGGRFTVDPTRPDPIDPGGIDMYDHNQLEIPDSFMALFLAPGRSKPSATRVFVSGRYELCEDLANHLDEYARAQHHDLGISAAEVLKRCHAGLLAAASGVNEAEAAWVVRRLAELEGWACPELTASA